MKSITYYLLILLLSMTCKPSFSQDFWEIVPTPDTANPWTLTFNTNGDIWVGSNGVYLSQDNGETWEFKGIYGKTIISIAIDSVGNIFAGTPTKLYKSVDYGETWQSLTDVVDVVSLGICKDGLMFAGMPFYIFRSFDYGATWDTSFIFPGWWEYAEDFAFQPPHTIYVGTTAFMGNGGGVYRSVDYGYSWEHIGLLYSYVRAIGLNSSGVLYAAVYGHHYTGIGGCYVYDEINSDWIKLTEDSFQFSDIAINSENVIFLGVSNEVGGPGGVYRSDDEGISWEWINSGLYSNTIETLCISFDEYIYAITYNSHILNRSVHSTVVIEDWVTGKSEVDVYPNPIKSYIYFKIALGKTLLRGSLMVFDIQGKRIMEMDLSNIQISHPIYLNAKEWPAGTYCYCIILDNFVQSGKMIKIN